MLVLSRRKNQAIVINGDIRVLVIGISGKTVRLAIEAPRQIQVHREEVVHRRSSARPTRPHRKERRQGHRSSDPASPAYPARSDNIHSVGDSGGAVGMH